MLFGGFGSGKSQLELLCGLGRVFRRLRPAGSRNAAGFRSIAAVRRQGRKPLLCPIQQKRA
jgi:hypothetical protein